MTNWDRLNAIPPSGDLRAAGDLMQSSLSRIIETIDAKAADLPALGYETCMAIHEGRSAIEDWTRLRRADATPLPTTGGASMSILVPFAVTSDMGVRVWMAEDADHAREQHEDAFPDEPIESVAAA